MADIHTKTPTKSPVALAEEQVLAFWREKNVFQKTLDKAAPNGNYVFYDGPPFATGLPHYGHILISAIKDAVPRYQTMCGKHVERRWGWDCHGLPIENIVEKDLKVSGKKEIEALDIDVFNEYARSRVLDFADHWKTTIERIGRWVDYDGGYKTMDNTFIESVWWGLKNIWDKNLIYEGTKVLPYCPRCETPISNSEIAMDGSYKDITDISVYVKLALVDEPKTFLIVWTTTPWTLPGNTAAAVNAELDYVLVKSGDEYFIVAKDKTSIFKEKFEIVEEMKGSELVGKKFKPPFDYFENKPLPGKENETNRENAWKVYAAPYVTAEAGSGIVHLAPAYGEEDMALARQFNIPFIRHVGSDGKFTTDVTDFVGLKAKPKEDHQSSDVQIIKNLAARGVLFAKEKIIHSYPHCYRCETPLFYFAIPAWFIKIQDVKKELIKNNEDITWIPEHLKHGRFGKTMEGAPDWNISRNRYWASPLPFWKCDHCAETLCISSLEDIKKHAPARNTYVVMRHGEAEHNLTDTVSCLVTDKNGLTEKGRKEVTESAKKLAANQVAEGEASSKEKVSFIYASDLVRAKETAEIVAAELGLSSDKIVYLPDLGELRAGIYNGKTWTEYRKSFAKPEDRFEKAPEGGETLTDMRNRVVKTLYDIEQKHAGENILIISHGENIFFLENATGGASKQDLIYSFIHKSEFLGTGQSRPLDFAPIPHNKNFELDFHRPYIDEIVFACQGAGGNSGSGAGSGKCGGTMRRIPEVVDCWLESASMPFAQNHYPFEHKERFEKNFPADFVAEYISQTRTWFYYMHAISTILFQKAPFKHVLTTGIIVAEDGEKMSKSKGNFPDPQRLFDKYGVDALRFYMLSSPLVKSEDLSFTEKGVDEVYKKIILRLKNTLTFYETYRGESRKTEDRLVSKHVLDRWIIERMNQVISEVTTNMEAYVLDRALFEIDGFIEDLSVWFLRRSRERLKSENEIERNEALDTFYCVLVDLAKIMAPFTPFLAEQLYAALDAHADGGTESVHLEEWPDSRLTPVEDVVILSDMMETRRIVSLALEARAKAKIKVRQPLAKLVVKTTTLENKQEYLDLIRDEVNVKEIEFDTEIVDEVVLDTDITPALQEEGNVRELVRAMQDQRKKAGLKAGDQAEISVRANEMGKTFILKFESELKKSALLSNIIFTEEKHVETDETISIEGMEFVFRINGN